MYGGELDPNLVALHGAESDPSLVALHVVELESPGFNALHLNLSSL
jgi:hypothetical protein